MLLRRLMIPAVAVALALSLALTVIGFWAGRTIVQIMSDRLIREVTQAVSRDVAHIVGGADRALSGVANDLVRHDVPLGDPVAVARELYGLLTVQRDVDWLYFGNEAGGLVSVGRLPDGKTVFLMTDGFRAGIIRQFEALPGGGIGRLIKSEAIFDTRQKIWYTRAKETSKPVLDRSLSGRRTHRRRFSLYPRHRQERQLRRSVRDRPYPDTARQPHADAPAR